VHLAYGSKVDVVPGGAHLVHDSKVDAVPGGVHLQLVRPTDRHLTEEGGEMTRHPVYAAGQFYHFYNRGAHRMSIFREPENYLFVLRKMKHYSRELNVQVIAYSLLPNHYHLLVRQGGETPASMLPQRIFNSYSKAYNRRYDHSGTLFEGHCKVKHVRDEAYLINLCRYIHGNPVHHGIVEDVHDWPYSNYLEWLGERPGTLVDQELVGAHYPDRSDYAAAVRAYLADPDKFDEFDDW
jgi:putative transposase